MRKNAGFTLIEILAALLILAIGLAAVVGLVIGAQRIANSTSDRNIAKALITEAVADIQRMHLIGETMPGVGPVPAVDVGLLLITLDDPTFPGIHHPIYRAATFEGKPVSIHFDSYKAMPCFDTADATYPGTAKSTFLWPWLNDAKLLGGATNTNHYLDNNYAYRVIYRLERHPTWVAEDDDSIFSGTYVLTLTAYRDVAGERVPSTDQIKRGFRLEQLSDPMVVYIRDKKRRTAE